MGDHSPTLPALLLNDSWNDSTTAESYGETTEAHYTTFTIFHVAVHLQKYLSAIIVFSGIFGNIMIMVIMRRMMSGESTINFYFTALAAMDLVHLCIGTLPEWIRHVSDFRLNATHDVVCKIFTWLYTGSSTISCWYLVCMTVHRAMSVVWPHRVNLMCTRRTVLLLIFGIALFFAVLYSHYLIGAVVLYFPNYNGYWCTMNPANESYMYFIQHIFMYIELAVYNLLPFLFLAVSNSVLIWKLTASVKTAGKFLGKGDSEQAQAREKAARSVTVTVSVVSIAFLVLTLPSTINYILFHFESAGTDLVGYRTTVLIFIAAICETLYQANTAINFYLYCLTGRRFREEFIKIMCCGRNRRQRGAHQ
ncbi:hypothetical protein ACOMHN_055348 [Nucella lapillus]